MGKHGNSRSSSRSLSRNQIECKSDIRKRKNSSTSRPSYKEGKRRKCSRSPSRSGSKIQTHDKSRKYSSELPSTDGTKKYYKRETSSSSTNTSRSSGDSDSSHKKRRKHKRKKRVKKDSSSSESKDSSSSECESSSSSSTVVAKKKHRKEKKRRKDKKRRKKGKKAKKKLKQKKERLSIGPEMNAIELEMPTASSNNVIEDRLLTDRAKAMAPMTKEEWETRQSIIRRVFDEETGRHRLIKGDGEVLEEIVSRDRHREINRQATKGDGDFFQATLAAKQCK